MADSTSSHSLELEQSLQAVAPHVHRILGDLCTAALSIAKFELEERRELNFESFYAVMDQVMSIFLSRLPAEFGIFHPPPVRSEKARDQYNMFKDHLVPLTAFHRRHKADLANRPAGFVPHDGLEQMATMLETFLVIYHQMC